MFRTLPHRETPLLYLTAALSLQQIRSPLTRVGYAVPVGHAALILAQAGGIGLVSPDDGAEVAEVLGARLIWLPPGARHEIKARAGTRATLLFVRDTVIAHALTADAVGGEIRRALEQRISLPLDDPNPFLQIVDGLARERVDRPPGSELAQELYITLLLLQVWRLLRIDISNHGRAPQGIAERFVALAHHHMRDHWPIARYASTLQVSRERLGSAVQRSTGLSPQAYLHQVLIREACELLTNTGMTVGQIAFRLGFADAGYFNRFFRARTGQTPGRYRRRFLQRQAGKDSSYAAWP